jgi:FkbM family methyltransferase
MANSSPLRSVVDHVESFFHIWKTHGLLKMIRVLIFNLIIQFSVSSSKEVTITTQNGYKMCLVPKDRGISKELRIFKVHEPMATKVMLREVKRGMTIVDIGSNIGYYAILESEIIGKEGKVIAVEPILRNFLYLSNNIRMNHLNNVKTVRAALSDRMGVVKMARDKGSNWCRVLDNSDQIHVETEEVGVTTGEELLEEFGNISLIRLDVEGHEDHVIRGFTEVIRKWAPNIFMEVHPRLLGRERYLHLLTTLKDSGYIVKHFIPRNLDVPLASEDEDITVVGIDELINRPWDWPFAIFLSH